jgi:hypothetical protein
VTLKVVLLGSDALANKKYEGVIGICGENLGRHLIRAITYDGKRDFLIEAR